MTNNISFYFHIPFCVKKCDYCAFYSLPAQSDELKQEYFEAMLRQIDGFDTDKTVKTVYFGGGTPPVLKVWRICALIERIKAKFTLSGDAEITVEVNPLTVDERDLKALYAAGVNRLSIGVQSSCDRILKLIGRIHSFTDARRCIESARRVGFKNISADIIFALPYQTTEEFSRVVTDVISTGVDHISAYSLQIEQGTPFYEKRRELILPDEDGEEEQYEALCDILKANGFLHYEISSFCKEGFQSRHNLNYWDCGEYFGFGAGAHSFFNKKRFSAENDVLAFIEKTKISCFEPTDYFSAEVISEQESAEEKILLGLRTAFGARIPESAHPIARRIAKMGFGEFTDGVLRLNSKGFRVSNEIIAEILT